MKFALLFVTLFVASAEAKDFQSTFQDAHQLEDLIAQSKTAHLETPIPSQGSESAK